MTKTIRIIRLAPGESVLITTAPDLKPSHEAVAICYPFARIGSALIILAASRRRKLPRCFVSHKGGIDYVCNYNLER